MGSCLSWLSQSGGGWLPWYLEVETVLLGLSPGMYDLPYGCVWRRSLCWSRTLTGFQDISFPIERDLLYLLQQECKKTKWSASLTARFPSFCPLHAFIVSSGCWVLVELRLHESFSGMSPSAVPVMLSLSYAEVSGKKISGFHIPNEQMAGQSLFSTLAYIPWRESVLEGIKGCSIL